MARGGSDDGGNRWSVDLVRNSSFYGEIEWRDAEAFVFDATAQEHVHAACSLLRRQAWVRRDPARDIAAIVDDSLAMEKRTLTPEQRSLVRSSWCRCMVRPCALHLR